MADNKTISLDSLTAKSIFLDIEKIEKDLVSLKKKIIMVLPAKYGSNLWWEKSIRQGIKDVKEGKYQCYGDSKDLIADLHKGI